MQVQRALILAVALAAAAQVHAQVQKIDWAKDWDTAEKTAAKEHKPIMIDFFTEW